MSDDTNTTSYFLDQGRAQFLIGLLMEEQHVFYRKIHYLHCREQQKVFSLELYSVGNKRNLNYECIKKLRLA